MTEKTYRRIADKINKIMKPYYDIDRKPGSKTDECMFNRPEIWEACEPYLDHLPEIWEQWKRENEANDDIQMVNNPYIKALDSYRVIDRLYRKIDSYVARDYMKRDRVILENWELAESIVSDSPYKLINSINSVEVEWKERSPVKWSPNRSEERRVIYQISEQILKELHINDLGKYD